MRHVDYFPSCFFLQLKIVKNIKKSFQVLFRSNVRGHFWLLKAQGLGCPPLPPKVFRKTFKQSLEFWKHCFILFNFLDFHRTLIQCHVWQNLTLFCEKIYFEGHMGLCWELILVTSRATLFLTLNILVARGCIFLWWIETEFRFFYKQILKSRLYFTCYS